jgi:hypothetical protein
MASYQNEKANVLTLLDLLPLKVDAIEDPLVRFKEEVGVDVLITVGGKLIGIQVTEYSADEGLPKRPSRNSRAIEIERAKVQAKKQRGVQAYGMTVSAEYLTAMKHRIDSKVIKHAARVDEVWLLVVAQDGRWGHTSSTFVAAEQVNIHHMNAVLDESLRASLFSRAFFLLCQERFLSGWNRAEMWQEITARPVLPNNGAIAAMRKKLFPDR